MSRRCGGCTLCCRLLPVQELDKPADTRCSHQRTGKGCAIYRRAPFSCRAWSCLWLLEPEKTRELRRPDRSGYVIDVCPDYVTVTEESGEKHKLPVLQVWVDPRRPDSHEDPALRSLLLEFRFVALLRYGSHRAHLLLPPFATTEKKWRLVETGQEEAPHTAADIYEAIGRGSKSPE